MAKRKRTKGQKTIYKHTYKTKDRVTRTPLKTGDELRCSGRVRSSCCTSDTRRVNLVTNPVITLHEVQYDQKCTTNTITIITLYYMSICICKQGNNEIIMYGWHIFNSSSTNNEESFSLFYFFNNVLSNNIKSLFYKHTPQLVNS